MRILNRSASFAGSDSIQALSLLSSFMGDGSVDEAASVLAVKFRPVNGANSLSFTRLMDYSPCLSVRLLATVDDSLAGTVRVSYG